MRRRDLLLGGMAGAVGASAPALARSRDPIERCLHAMDLQLERVRERAGPFLTEVPGFLGEPGLDVALQRALDGLIQYGNVASLTPEQQADERIQARLWSAADHIGSSVSRLARELASIDEDKLERLHQVLLERPDVVEGTLASIESETAALNIPDKVRDQLLRTVRETSFDLTHGQKSGATKRHLARFKRLHHKVSESEDPLSLLSQTPEEELAIRKAVLAGAAPSHSIAGQPGDITELGDAKNRALGGLLLALGVITSAVLVGGVIASGGFLALCICVGIPVLTSAILLLVAGALLSGPS